MGVVFFFRGRGWRWRLGCWREDMSLRLGGEGVGLYYYCYCYDDKGVESVYGGFLSNARSIYLVIYG